MYRATKGTVGLAVLTMCGCSLFQRDKPCHLGASACDGDRVRQCGQDEQASYDQGELVTRWSTVMTCSDDPELGPYTCGVVDGRATCVAENGPDAGSGAALAGPEDPWIRVTVKPIGDGTVQIVDVTPVSLGDVAPPKPAAGAVAVVGYRDGEVVDATLVPLEPDQSIGQGWIHGDRVDHVAAVDSQGGVHSSVDLSTGIIQQIDAGVVQVDPSKLSDAAASFDVDAGSASAADAAEDLEEAFEEPEVTRLRPALELAARYGKRTIPVSESFRALVNAALDRVPDGLILTVPRALLVLDQASASLADGAPIQGATESGDAPRASWVPLQQVLVLDFTAARVAEYQRSTLLLAQDIVRATIKPYLDSMKQWQTDMILEAFLNEKAEDFPPELSSYLTRQYAGLLADKETPAQAWDALHRVAVSAKLASPYQNVFGTAPNDDATAVAAGFASKVGSAFSEADLGEYVIHASVPERWSPSPCAALREQPLDELSPPLLVHVAKLLALRGLDLLRPASFAACVGELRLSAAPPTKGALVLHTPSGDRVRFDEEVEGARQPYYREEVRLSWKARRKYMGVSLSAGYVGEAPTVMRLNPVGAKEGGRYGAVFVATDPDGYQTSVAQGGLYVLSKATPARLESFALMVQLSAEQVGTKVLPLVSAQVLKPEWEDAL